MRYDQPGANNGPGSGLAVSQYPHPNEAGHPGTGVPETNTKPSKFGGKVETAIGTMIGSDSLRAKGIEKERSVCSVSYLISPGLKDSFPHPRSEARNLTVQSNELAQAESLEREAQLHRDRAMAGGEYSFEKPRVC